MLKEQDPLIEMILEGIMSPGHDTADMDVTITDIFQGVQDMMLEHHENPEGQTRLKKYVPSMKKVFLPLDLVSALKEYDAKKHLLARKRVPPTFKEVRHVLNLSVVNAIAGKLKLVTFDADDTIYEDGGSISATSRMVTIIVELLRRGLVVSLVTAAGYPGNPGRYEERLRGILDALESCTKEERARFLVMGGECNYLLETYTKREDGKVYLREIDGALWKDGRGMRWKEEEVQALLDLAEKTLEETTAVLHMHSAKILRKERAVGIYNTSHKRFAYENLEELCLTLQYVLKDLPVPCCAFNGGNDVWVDIGNKALGIQALQNYVFRFLPKDLQGDELTKIQGMECLHVGDRFTRTGNDTRSRDAATTVWVSDPRETRYIMKKLLNAIDAARGEEARRPSIPATPAQAQREARVEAAIQAATEDTLAKE
ncbi:hypothetical protein Poli38472_010062 [Pythium oligandrum]|uniref:IMP-specific 5'-nucleotidase 1 n=1 Tax=Pythium oligandrum TaxID=41045 RepID=A0A8K1C8S1_PYTOL|nr:hypothetical protein Poli38472_010062 [Pythium oligandrum]|eukprot:TMW58503.1 hypothetical protein Poli38472_010062 [Pythium oligandrum]